MEWTFAPPILVNARSLIEQNPKALKLIETNQKDSPLSVQLFGGVKEEMRDASIILQELGVDSIDVNMGCPVPKVTKTGGGASMMNELPKTQELIRSMVDTVNVPITAKMRLGWDDKNLTAPDLAHALEDAGVTAIFVHGPARVLKDSDGIVNLMVSVRSLRQSNNIPVIGNGDITTPQAAQAYDRTDRVPWRICWPRCILQPLDFPTYPAIFENWYASTRA